MAQADTTKPILTSLSPPSLVDVTGGSRIFTFSAGASDTGTGVDSVQVYFDKQWQDSFGGSSYAMFFDSTDSFADGLSG